MFASLLIRCRTWPFRIQKISADRIIHCSAWNAKADPGALPGYFLDTSPFLSCLPLGLMPSGCCGVTSSPRVGRAHAFSGVLFYDCHVRCVYDAIRVYIGAEV